jgi:hypothetical protein
MLHKDYETSVQLKKNIGRKSQGAWHQDELIGGKPRSITRQDAGLKTT